MYTYGWFVLKFDRKQQNSVKQLSFNKKKKLGEKKKTLAPWKKSYDQPRQHIKKQRHYFVNKVHLVKAMVFSVVSYGC